MGVNGKSEILKWEMGLYMPEGFEQEVAEVKES